MKIDKNNENIEGLQWQRKISDIKIGRLIRNKICGYLIEIFRINNRMSNYWGHFLKFFSKWKFTVKAEKN